VRVDLFNLTMFDRIRRLHELAAEARSCASQAYLPRHCEICIQVAEKWETIARDFEAELAEGGNR
jgi:hypothetical protein